MLHKPSGTALIVIKNLGIYAFIYKLSKQSIAKTEIHTENKSIE